MGRQASVLPKYVGAPLLLGAQGSSATRRSRRCW